MLRRCFPQLIGAEENIFLSRVKDKRYLEHRLALLGQKDETIRPLTDEEIKRFTTSVGSAESLFNKRAESTPTNVVDEETNRVVGSTLPDPTRYGDWELHGRCCDF